MFGTLFLHNLTLVGFAQGSRWLPWNWIQILGFPLTSFGTPVCLRFLICGWFNLCTHLQNGNVFPYTI